MSNEEKKKKKNPVGVRMDQKMTEKIKKDFNLTSDQQVVNFLFKLYEQTFCPIPIPTLERQNPIIDRDHGKKSTKPVVPAEKTGIPASAASSPEKKTHPLPVPSSSMESYSEEDAARIAELQAEIEKGAPKEFTAIGKKNYFYDRNKEINEIKAKYESK